jgi:glycosyltransferase involved in cell wall biosynthesis
LAPPVLVVTVIPAYNSERFLLDAARSVLGQTHADLQLIIVDDGSTDRTLELARSIPDSRVRVLSISNSGPAAARNTGIAAARGGAYVAFLDADDLWEHTKVARQVDWLLGHPEHVAVGCFMRYVSSGGRALGRTGQRLRPGDRERIARGEFLPFPMSSLMIRGSALEEVGGFDESFRGGSEDLEFFARVAGVGQMECLPEVLGSYRLHPQSAMARNRRRINEAARFARRRIAMRAQGRDLTWDAFLAERRPTWGERRRDLVEVAYRAAALWYGEGRRWRAAWYGLIALLIHPRYTIRRLRRQRGNREPGRPSDSP